MTTMNSGIMTPGWEWEKIMEDWNKHGSLYNGIPEILEAEPAYILYNGISLGLEIEEEPVHITMKTVYEIEGE